MIVSAGTNAGPGQFSPGRSVFEDIIISKNNSHLYIFCRYGHRPLGLGESHLT
jgi:hypothetical protein